MHHTKDRIVHTTAFARPVVEHCLEREIVQWVHSTKDLQLAPLAISVLNYCAFGLRSTLDRDHWRFFSQKLSFQLVLNDWCNNGRGMRYPVCVMMHIK